MAETADEDDEPESSLYEMILDTSKTYITLDKRTGFLVRVFN